MRTTEPKTEPSPASEAYRYVANAKETLDKKAKLNSDYQAYEDRKYVRAAGHYLWLSVLIMLEAKYHLKKNKRSRVDIDERDHRPLRTPYNTKTRIECFEESRLTDLHIHRAATARDQ